MNLILPSAPHACIQTLRAVLEGPDAEILLRPALEPAQPGDEHELSVTAPLENYRLTAQDLLGPAGLSAASPAGWSFAIEADRRTIAIADLVASDGGEGYRLALVAYDRPLTGITDALIMAEHEAADTKDALARRLEIPALHVVALWLRSSQDDWRDDRLFVIPGTAEQAASIEGTSAGELLTTLEERARDAVTASADGNDVA